LIVFSEPARRKVPPPLGFIVSQCRVCLFPFSSFIDAFLRSVPCSLFLPVHFFAGGSMPFFKLICPFRTRVWSSLHLVFLLFSTNPSLPLFCWEFHPPISVASTGLFFFFCPVPLFSSAIRFKFWSFPILGCECFDFGLLVTMRLDILSYALGLNTPPFFFSD